MKKIFKSLLSITCTAAVACGISACGTGAKAEELGAPKETTALTYAERHSEKVKTVSSSAEKFSAEFASLAYGKYKTEDNFAVAPVSVYMALSLAAQSADGNTRSEILSALGISYNDLFEGFSDYYRSLFAEYRSDGKLNGQISLSNSIWVDTRVLTKQDCIQTLADKFHCYSYKADFYNDTAAVNRTIRKFVKDKTKGLIDRDFQLSNRTLYALINTLYLKDTWSDFGDDLLFTNQNYNFINYDKTEKKTKLLQGYYCEGRAVDGEKYKTFFAETANGNKLKFILPDDGYSVDDIFTAKNLAEINGITDYQAKDEVNKIKYSTRCQFPEFSASFNKNIKDLLADMGIKDLFDENCNFSTLTDNDVFCSAVTHATKLNVDKKGIEGAAVTIMEVDDSAQPPEYENVFYDFVIDRAFGFILTDKYDNTLFSGVVKNI